MPSSYIPENQYGTYNIPTGTSTAAIVQASVLVDTYLRRPEGLEYVADDVGNPCWMKSLTPTGVFTIPAGLAPGNNVSAVLTGPMALLQQGTVLIADKDTPAGCEPLVVASITGNTVTFRQVTKTHIANVNYHAGLTIFESKYIPTNRPLLRLSKNPVLRLLMGQGRYGYGRRGGANNYTLNEFNLLAVMSQFGGPPVWEGIDLSHTDFNPETGEVWVPAGIMLAYYSEVRISYIAGFASDSCPDIIKYAVSNIVNSQAASPLSGNMKLIKAGDTTMERFLDTVLDSDTRLMLATYRARTNA